MAQQRVNATSEHRCRPPAARRQSGPSDSEYTTPKSMKAAGFDATIDLV
jgi:hypothetical protein